MNDRLAYCRCDENLSLRNTDKSLPEFDVQSLLQSAAVAIRDTYCRGSCRHPNAEECTTSTQLVFPYRGVYVRHIGHDQTVCEANQVLFFNAFEGYRVSHPLPGGDASLTLLINEEMLRELSPFWRRLCRSSATRAWVPMRPISVSSSMRGPMSFFRNRPNSMTTQWWLRLSNEHAHMRKLGQMESSHPVWSILF